MTDMRDPTVVAELHRQAALMAQHPQDAELNQWIEDVTDYRLWGPYDNSWLLLESNFGSA